MEKKIRLPNRHRERDLETALKKQIPIYCAGFCIAVKKFAPTVDAETLKDLLIEVQNAIDEHPADIFRTCKLDTGVVIKMEGDFRDEGEAQTAECNPGNK